MQNDNSTCVLTQLAANLAIPVTRQTISEELERHPDYDSIRAFSDVLDRLHVSNAAYKLKFDELTKVPLPFIAHLSQKEFAVVTQFDDKQATLANEHYHNKAMPVADFKKLYSGTVLVAEKDEKSGEPDYPVKRRAELINDLRLPVLFGGGVLALLGLVFFNSPYLSVLNLPIFLLTSFKTAGLITAVLLLTQSINANNPLLQKLCGGDDGKNCNAILSSKAAKVNAYLSWSEVGFFYFAGTWLILLFNSSHNPVMQVLAILNIFSLPYTVYSIYYQWRVAKQWCIFCCMVQALLWLEFFTFLPYLVNGLQAPTFREISSLVISFGTPILGWMAAKPYLLQSKQIKPLKRQLSRFKYNTELFDKMISNEVKYALPTEENSLIIGNKEAENVITMVASPYCQPCAQAYKALEWIENRDDVKLQIVFSTANDSKNQKKQVASHLLAIQEKHGGITLRSAMNAWYNEKDYDAWVKMYPAEKIDTEKQIIMQRDWCKLVGVTGTPTLFINGRVLPNNYQPNDLKYFI